MGAADPSLDARLVERLRDDLPFTVFVETGTFEGESVARMLPYFGEIHTIELSEAHAAAAERRFRDDHVVRVHRGTSPEVLASLRPELRDRSVLYWLDAHWCDDDDTAGVDVQCPLLGELAALGELNDESLVLIDDARLFLAPPPAPHRASEWPRFHQVLTALLDLGASHEIMVINDVIAFFPPAVAPSIVEYARTNAVDLLASVVRVEALEQEREQLRVTLDERLDAINELTRTATERLELIERLHAAVHGSGGNVQDEL